MKHFHYMLACLAVVLAACDQDQDPLPPQQTATDPNVMTFSVTHPADRKAGTRATSTAFEADDRIGLYITESDGILQASGNYLNNAPLTFDGTAWQTAEPVYWNSGTYNVYAYYPYTTPIQSVDDMPFRVAADQQSTPTDGTPGGYEARDLLFASSTGVSASGQPVELQFRHCMSRLQIRLVKGEDFEGDFPEEAEVYVHNTVPGAGVRLEVGRKEVRLNF